MWQAAAVPVDNGIGGIHRDVKGKHNSLCEMNVILPTKICTERQGCFF